ncbi:nitrate reductase [soil metagenome]
MNAAPARETRSTCPYCGVGCGVVIESRGDAITGVRGDPDHPANFGRLCSKGATLHLTSRPDLQASARLLAPEMRADRSMPRAPVGWDPALDRVTDEITGALARGGPDSIGLYISGQLLTEDYYVFNKLAKGLLGTNNVDTNSRLCMSSAVSGYKLTLGADAPPACYEDIDHADLLFIAGSNTAWAHPILFRRIEDARARNPAMRIIVVDPRVTDTARMADLHLALLPGTDVALFNGLLHLLLWDDHIDSAFIDAHTQGFAELKRSVRDFTPSFTANLCGLQEADIVAAAEWFGSSKAVLSMYCQGLNQSSAGTDKNAALINLHLATGQIGRRGAGPLSLTGQPNAMGGREVGGMATLLGAHRDINKAEDRDAFAKFWGVDRLPDTPGLTAVKLFEAAADGAIDVLWIACTNPAQSLPDQKVVRRAFERTRCVIVQEAYRHTASVEFADVVLPASSWGERDGTVTNSERRISRVLAAIEPAGSSRADWRIAVDVARRLEATLRPGQPSLFPYETAEAVWNEHRETTRGRDLDITGLSYERLEFEGPQQWPCVDEQPGKARLYEDGRFATDNGRARFVITPYRPVAEGIDARHPIRLTTGRLRDQWHAMSRTGLLGRLFAHVPEPVVELNPSDMGRRRIEAGDLVRIRSRRGQLVLPASPSTDIRQGQAFIAMHWGSEFMAGEGVNAVTIGALDPVSKQPELKHSAVGIEAVALPWRVAAFGWFDAAAHAEARLSLRACLGEFEYGVCLPFGREPDDATATPRMGLLLRAAAAQAVPAATLRTIEAVFGLVDGMLLRYDDAQRSQHRRMRVADGKLQAVSIAGDIGAEQALRELLESDVDVRAIGARLLAPSISLDAPARRTVICNCKDVDATSIAAGIDAYRVAAGEQASEVGCQRTLEDTLGCGTVCGSCKPEVLSAIRLRPVRAVADAAAT